MVEESSVNSVWSSILSTYYFPFPEYIIKPEARLGGSGHRADLLVTRSRDSKVVMIIEGKKAGGAQATWDRSVKQSEGYYNPVNKLGVAATRVFCMAAVGRKAAFVAPSIHSPESGLWGIKVQRGKAMSFRGIKALDIMDNSSEIHALLSHIKNSAVSLAPGSSNSWTHQVPLHYRMMCRSLIYVFSLLRSHFQMSFNVITTI